MRIVLTGAPGSGKSTAIREIARRFPDRCAIVPEAATMFYEGIGLNWKQLTLAERYDAQEAIYRLQVENERRVIESHPSRTIVLDRGTVDGSAYWPDGPDAYWRRLKTTRAGQLARYDRVLLLETAAKIGIYDGPRSNRSRGETLDEAIVAAEVIARVWQGHPDLHSIRATRDFENKLAQIMSHL
jgi:predicted ATPase